MQNLPLRLPQTPTMRSLGALSYHKKLLLDLSRSKFLSSNPPKVCSSFHRSLCSGPRGSAEQPRVLGGDSDDPRENPRGWSALERFGEGEAASRRVETFYDPVTGELVTKVGVEDSPEDESAAEGAMESGLSWPALDSLAGEGSARPRLRRGKNLEAESGEEEENRMVDTFFDPMTGQIVPRADLVGSPVEEVPAVEESVRKGPVKGIRKSDVNERAEKVQAEKMESWSSVVARRRTGKVKVSWVCESCGAKPSQWWGTCPSCNAVGSVKQFSESDLNRARGAEVSEMVVRSWLPQRPGELVPQSLVEVNKGRKQAEWRIPLSGHFGMEVSRVLGGGLVPGSLVLVGGDPGVGKSTLLLQLAAIVAQGNSFKGPAPVIYVSGEESIEQIGSRADRMRITTADLFLYSSTDIEDILDKIQVLSPQALIVDSIQTVYLRGVTGSAGNVMQVKECTSALLRFAKQTNIPVLLIGHVTKSGDIAGPRMLEHIVDAVLYMEGERYSSYRLLRSVKNRFGSTDELGVFEMSESGLQAVSNPSEMFLSEHYSDSEILAGVAVAVVIDGSRTFVVEIQALCASGLSISRQVNGVTESRAALIIAVLTKQAGLKLQDNAIFVNVVSGFKLTETAGDLAIAAAICSSFLEIPIPNDVAFIGEIGLSGELRAVPRMDKRVIAIAKLGYKRCVVPKTTEKLLAALQLDIKILGCRTVKDVINTVFSTS